MMHWSALRLSTAVFVISIHVPAEARPPCAGLDGQARRECLSAEVERGRLERERIDRKLRRIDTAKTVVCGVRDFGGHLAGGGGASAGSSGGPAGTAAGWAAGRASYGAATGRLDKAMGNPHACVARVR